MFNPPSVEYQEYEAEWQRALTDPQKRRIASTWFDTDTLDAWRHGRMRAPLLSIVKAEPDASWLTVGDGRFGTDGNFLIRSGAKNVHCTDVSDTLLKVGYEKKFITSFSAENAERLSFEDGAFDYVYCKESFHHFSRPYAALYEMYRVAKKGVILTEPRDTSIDKEPLELLKDFVKSLLRRKSKPSHAFEPIGNYIYSISEKELEKAALGLDSKILATIGCNDAYEDGVEFISMHSTDSKDVTIRDNLFSKIDRLDLLCRLGIKRTTLISAAIFKQDPSASLLSALTGTGWTIHCLPKNPYKE
jgi:ubiquinone/menaquinone biosynthesis C-methylase UbiE